MKEECIFLRDLSSIPNIDITIPTNWLLINSMSNNMNISDVMIRYLVVKEFYTCINSNEKELLYNQKGKMNYDVINELGFPMMALYYKMQSKRAEYVKKISTINVENSVFNFIDLIEKVDKYGFDTKYPLEINQNFCLLDGAHRLALALYHKVPKVKIFFYGGLNFTPNYSLQWFKDMNMVEYVDIIMDTYKTILKENSSIYIMCSSKKIDFGKYKEKFFIEEIQFYEELTEQFDFLNNCKLENNVKFWKLISKFNNDKTIYPIYSEEINIPMIINEIEKELITFCNSKNIILMKQKGDKNV